MNINMEVFLNEKKKSPPQQQTNLQVLRHIHYIHHQIHGHFHIHLSGEKTPKDFSLPVAN